MSEVYDKKYLAEYGGIGLMKTPQGWTNYSGDTYFVRVPMVPARIERSSETVKDESSNGTQKPAEGKVAAQARW